MHFLDLRPDETIARPADNLVEHPFHCHTKSPGWTAPSGFPVPQLFRTTDGLGHSPATHLGRWQTAAKADLGLRVPLLGQRSPLTHGCCAVSALVDIHVRLTIRPCGHGETHEQSMQAMVNLRDMGRLLLTGQSLPISASVVSRNADAVHAHAVRSPYFLHRKLLPPRPADDRLRHLDAWLIRERDGQREGFPWTHGKITREPPPVQRKVPHGALPLEWARVVCNGAL